MLSIIRTYTYPDYADVEGNVKEKVQLDDCVFDFL